MNTNRPYCEECIEEIPKDEVYWDEKRLYCGRCGSEIQLSAEISNVFDTIVTQSAGRLWKTEDDEIEDDEEDGEDEDERVDDEETRETY